MVVLTDNERARYVRHLPLIGEEGQQRLKASTALVTRCGGVGGAAALYLAAAGIGRLIMVHEGNTTWSNLNRMVLQTYDWVGKPRIVKIRESIHRLNPDVEVIAIAQPFTETMGSELSAQADVLLSCTPRARRSQRHLHPPPQTSGGSSDERDARDADGHPTRRNPLP